MHIAGNPISKTGLEEVLLRLDTVVIGAAALYLLIRPGRVPARVVLAAGVVVSLVLEAPVTGNHWLLAAIVSVAILASSRHADPWARFSRTARPILLGFYFFAAFAKLNSGFFDPVESCARFYANQTLDGFGLPEIGGEGLPIAVAVAVAATELSVPVLLFFRRSRALGVLVGVTFHFLVSLDLNQHFYDFSGVLFALFALFLTDRAITEIGGFALGERAEVVVLGVGAPLVALMAIAPPSDIANAVRVMTFVPWFVFGVTVVVRLWRRRPVATKSGLRPAGVLAWALLAVVVANGLTPYLEIKTATSWNMYANLVTHDGESNHFLIRETLPIWDRNSDLLVVVASTDERLQRYADTGYAIPRRNLENYLADNPTAVVTVMLDGEETVLTSADGDNTNVFVDKFLSFRSVDVVGEPGCQAGFLPAR